MSIQPLVPAKPQTTFTRSRSGSRSSTSSVLSMSSFGAISHASTLDGEAPTAPPQLETGPEPTAPTVALAWYKHSSQFFMTDKVVRFLSGDVLFQVHSSVLERHSAWFRAQLILPDDALPPGWHEAQDVAGAPNGLSIFVHSERGEVSCTRPSIKHPDAEAIILDDISADELAAFLSVLYPSDFNTFELDATNDRDWTAVLKVAHRWDCPTIKALAIERLDNVLSGLTDLDVTETHFKRLMLARAYDVDSWVDKALYGLCKHRCTLREEQFAQMCPADISSYINSMSAYLYGTTMHKPELEERVQDNCDVEVASVAESDEFVLPGTVKSHPDSRDPSPPPSTSASTGVNGHAEMRDVLVRSATEIAVEGLLGALTTETFDLVSEQILDWTDEGQDENDGRTIRVVVKLIYDKATDGEDCTEVCALLCRKMVEQVSNEVQDLGILNDDGKPRAGGLLFRKYLLNRCQDDFERGWLGPARKECYAAMGTKRRRLGLIRFIAELFRMRMLAERTVHELIKTLLGNVENPDEDEIESLCKLFTSVGSIIDTFQARMHMDVYFSRMEALSRSKNVNSRMVSLLQDVIELRKNHWQPPRN